MSYQKKPLRKYAMVDFSDAVEIFLRFSDDDPLFYSLTLFCKPLKDVRQRIRVTKMDKNSFRVTFGKPNYEERTFLKDCKAEKCSPKRLWFHYKRKKR